MTTWLISIGLQVYGSRKILLRSPLLLPETATSGKNQIEQHHHFGRRGDKAGPVFKTDRARSSPTAVIEKDAVLGGHHCVIHGHDVRLLNPSVLAEERGERGGTKSCGAKRTRKKRNDVPLPRFVVQSPFYLVLARIGFGVLGFGNAFSQKSDRRSSRRLAP